MKCDERLNGCLNCERLQLDCVQNGAVSTAAKRSSATFDSVVGIKRKRTYRSCAPCRDSKVKCSGERPTCSRCQQRRTTCTYDADQNEPVWVQSITGTPTGQTPDNLAVTSPQPHQPPQTPISILGPLSNADTAKPGCPPGLSWYAASSLFSVVQY